MSSIVLSSDALKTTPSIGEMEHDGKIFTATPQANTQRGIVPTEQFFRLNSNLTGANATGAQNIFGVGVTLAGSTVYEFEISAVILKSAGTTAHTISSLIGGTATINNIQYSVILLSDNTYPTGTTAPSSRFAATNSTSAVTISSSITSAVALSSILIKGTVSVNAGGTFIPRYSLSAAPGGAYTTQIGSYMKIKPIGSSGSNTVVGTWS